MENQIIMGIRVVTGSDGSQRVESPMFPELNVQTAADKAAAERAAAQQQQEAPLNYRQGGVRTRVEVDSETGESRVTVVAPETSRVSTPDLGAVYATTPSGQNKPLSLATLEDTVDLPSLGGRTSIKAALALGEIQPRAGGGFEPVRPQQQAEVGQQQRQAQQAQEQANADVPVTAADVRGITGTSAQTDATMSTLRQAAPGQVDHFIEAIASGRPVNFDDAARSMRDEHAPAKLQAAMNEYRLAGATVLRNVGVADLAGFEEYVREHHPEEASDAIRALVSNHDLAPLARLGKRYVSGATTRLGTLLNAKGADTRVENGTVYVKRSSIGLPPTPRRGDFGGSDWSTVADLMRDGIITR